MHINQLSSELLVSIFSNIDDLSQKVDLEKVCHRWRQIVPLDWKMTKTCPKPLIGRETLLNVLNRCGECLEELWLQNIEIDQILVLQMASKMKCLKHLKFSYCELDGPAADSINALFGQKLYSFILDETAYHPNMRRLIENNSSNLEHLSLNLSYNYSARTLPTKLPSNLKSFSLRTWDEFNADSLLLLRHIANDCKNLKILHLEIETLRSEMIMAIGNIKSLIYLNLSVNSIENEFELNYVICSELPNLKAINSGNCKKAIMLNSSRYCPNLIHFNVLAHHAFKYSDSLNSLTLRIPTTMNFDQCVIPWLIIQKNKSIQHLDIRSILLPFSSNSIEELLKQLPNLKSINCKMPPTNAELTLLFSSIIKHLEKQKRITFYLHSFQPYQQALYCKYILPDDLPQFKVGWRPKMKNGKCENFVLKKVIKKAIEERNEQTFLDECWME